MTHFTRQEWRARPYLTGGNEVTNGPEGVDVHYNGGPMGIDPGKYCDCAARVRSIQAYHMDLKGWKDIAYDVIACPHGNTFQGRIGTPNGTGANGSDIGNRDWMAVMGLWGDGEPLTNNLKMAILDGIELCRKAGAGTKIGPHSQHEQTTCPGNEAREWIAAGCPPPHPFLPPQTYTPAPDPEPDPLEPVPPPEPVPAPVPEPAPVPVPVSKDIIGEILRRGDRGEAVTYMQQRLNAHGFKVDEDGSFGPASEQALKNFQEARNLDVDGVCGDKTWAALKATPPTSLADARAYAKPILAKLGWRVDTDVRLTQAIKDFQGMWNLGPALDKDGIPGPKTRAALKLSLDNENAGKGNISANFDAKEFQCKCGGKYADCRRIWAARILVQGAEKYRTINGPFTPLSASRCKSHNAAVGGYYRSQHLYGYAMDVVARFSVSKVKALAFFPAIGYNASNNTVRHVDFRNSGPDNYPQISGSVTNPYTYKY